MSNLIVFLLAAALFRSLSCIIKMRESRILCPLFLQLLLVFGTFSITSTDVAALPHNALSENLLSDVVSFELDNGFRIIVAKRDVAPVFHAQLWVKVGGSDELPGKTGAAHLLEHMAFKGTKRIGTKNAAEEKKLLDKYDRLLVENPKDSSKLESVEAKLEKIWNTGEYTSLFEKHGAQGLNAGTSADYTMYTVALPASELEFWFSMEADRIMNPVFRQFYKELNVVLEERRMRTEDKPSGRLYEALLATAYWGHPYHSPTIGWKNDLKNLKRSDAAFLHKKYYRPDNMVAVIVGDVDESAVRELAGRYFGQIKRPSTPLEHVTFASDGAMDPSQRVERTVSIPYPAEPEFILGYHQPRYPDPDDVALSLLHAILDDGRSSVFQKDLVQKQQILSSVYTSQAPGQRFDPLFLIGGSPSVGVTYEKAIAAIEKSLHNLVLSKEQLDSAKKRVRFDVLDSMSKSGGLASLLGFRELLYGDWKGILEELRDIEAVSAEDLRRVIDRYFRANNRTLVKIETTRENQLPSDSSPTVVVGGD